MIVIYFETYCPLKYLIFEINDWSVAAFCYNWLLSIFHDYLFTDLVSCMHEAGTCRVRCKLNPFRPHHEALF